MENQEIMVKTRLTLAGRTYILSVLSEEEPIFQQIVATVNQQLTTMQAAYPRYDKQDFLANLLFNKSLELYKNDLELTAYKNSSSTNADSSIVPTPMQSHDLELEEVNNRLDTIRDLLAQSLQTN
jgi:hypothetical protein